MSDFVDKLKLKEQAEEDLFFARRERELVAGVRRFRSDAGGGRLKVVSGGQTGVDRAALDAAAELGLDLGGGCPAGRLAEDGVIPGRYPLVETPDRAAAQRTDWNVRDSDAKLILHRGAPIGGTRLTMDLARRHGRPLLLRDLGTAVDARAIADWLGVNRVQILNCAGPRESESPGITHQSAQLLRQVFALWKSTPVHPAD